MTTLLVTFSIILSLTVGCTTHTRHMDVEQILEATPPLQVVEKPEADHRMSLSLSPVVQKAHEAVMREHLEAIHQKSSP